MGSDVIQAQYDSLDAIANRFGESEAATTALHQHVARSYEALAQNGWEGEGHAAFTTEMNSTLMPAIQRLAGALRQAKAVTLEVKMVLQKADDEASRPFRGGKGAEDAGSDLDYALPSGNVDPAVIDIETGNTIDIGWAKWKEKITPAYKKFNGTVTPDTFSPDDIVQGQVGDCFFMAALTSVAKQNEAVLKNAIQDHGDGTYSVTFYRDGKPVQVTIDNEFPVSRDGSPAFAKMGQGTGELWPMIMEKAYAKFSGNDYAGIHGGVTTDALKALTNKSSEEVSVVRMPYADLKYSDDPVARLTLRNIETRLANKEFVTASTRSEFPKDAPGVQHVVAKHAYTVDHVDVANGLVYVRNPHGPSRTPRGLTLQEFETYFDGMWSNK